MGRTDLLKARSGQDPLERRLLDEPLTDDSVIRAGSAQKFSRPTPPGDIGGPAQK